MGHSTYDCIDAGTENCPCYLALTGDCLTCSRLQGKDYCDCMWKGVCIYNEFQQAGERINNPRKDFKAKITARKFYLDDLVVFVLKVGKGFALKATRPGSCVFLRAPDEPNFYQFPVSVMWADPDRGEIHLAVKILSAKTKTLYETGTHLVVRGVYRNGIQGIREIRRKFRSGGSSLLISKGIGFAPAVLLARTLRERGRVDFIIDKSKICDELISDYLELLSRSSKEESEQSSHRGTVHYLSFSEPKQLLELEELIETKKISKESDGSNRYDKVAILASDYYQKVIGEKIRRILPEAALGFSNNARLCCGEGICGACTKVTEAGETIRLCKCSFNENI